MARGLGRPYDAILPEVHGLDPRAMFNRGDNRTALPVAPSCGAFGLSSGGIAGAVIGFRRGDATTNGLLVGVRLVRP
jgi:hypothetical protein